MIVLDTGAAYSVMPDKTYFERFQNSKLKPSNIKFKTYTGQPINVLGEF